MINIPEEFILHSPTVPFPDIDSALEEPSGLIAIGGEYPQLTHHLVIVAVCVADYRYREQNKTTVLSASHYN